MEQFKSISTAGSLFHILVPGVFLLMNILAGLHVFSYTPDEVRSQIHTLFENPTVALTVIIGFGYLIGVVLRIFRSERPDRCSAWFLRTFDAAAHPPPTKANGYAYEDFPYRNWLGRGVRNLPDSVREFYDTNWTHGDSRTFLNYAKTVVISEDAGSAAEIYAGESLCRFISGMFYALVASLLLCVVVLVVEFKLERTANLPALIAVGAYLLAIVGILANYRFMRIKEVQTVFFAASKHPHLFVQKESVPRHAQAQP